MMAVDFDAVRRDHPLEAEVARVLPLRRAGGNKVAVCPFHPDKNPSLVLFKDETYHCFGCGAHGDVIDFVAGTQHITIGEAIRFLSGGEAPKLDDADCERRHAEARRREAEHRRKQDSATQDARSRWARALPFNGTANAYLSRKDVAPYGCRTEGANLLVPIYGADGLIQSVQSITPDGGKLFHAGAPVTGGTLTLGDVAGGPVVIVEGFATGATIQAATGLLVVVGFSKGALERTARIAAKRHQGRPIIVAADANGIETARLAAEAVGGRVVAPDMQGAEGTDFNDQAAHYGPEDVAAVFTPPPEQDRVLRATPFAWRDEAEIPPRKWLYGRHLLRRFVSVDVAAGGIGKSSLKIGEALALASGRELYGQAVHEGPTSVWIYNLEDPSEETERRVHAAAKRFTIKPDELGNRLYVDSGRDQRLTIAEETADGVKIVTPIVEALVAEISERGIDVLIVDPFVSSHAVSENDNNKIDVVAKEWVRIADLCNCSINLVHHVRKQNGAEANAESARGAVSLIGAARSVAVYNRMTVEEANRLGVPEDEIRFFFRVENDKVNLAPPEKAAWYRMNNVDLDNGDSVGVACAWSPPDPFQGLSVHDLIRVQQVVGASDWRDSPRAEAWVGKAVGEALGLDLDLKPDRARVTRLVAEWVRGGALEIVDKQDGNRVSRKFVVVGKWATP